jgi:hypothetical protein
MSSRDLGFTALGRCLAVERYRETCLASPPRQPRQPGPARTGGSTDRSDVSSGYRPPAARGN